MPGATRARLLWAGAPVGAVCLGAVLLRGKLVLIRVTGSSMAPSFGDGSTLLVRTGARARLHDVVVFRNPLAEHSPDRLEWLVKRVAALPGDPVPPEVRERVGARPGDPVPAGRLVVRGDAERTQDSRHFGYVPAASVLGTVVGGRRRR
ncbi:MULTISPECIES: S26 family signal peptidase [unclassified Streptomyces]|uniref:S26 family signal peptidase n=1 Tax=unclassified Streptomyces TaxID=2593676 RepID=UPI00344B15F6